jgi:alkyl hydroperoxide reductase subunit D
MNINMIKDQMKDYARDTKLNLSSILTPEGAMGLTPAQIYGIALACAYSLKSSSLAQALKEEAGEAIQEVTIEAAKGAATIMSMNNVYYRFTHLVQEPEFSKMPAKLRMNIIGKPGIDKKDFELMSLAVSTLSGCGKCIESHTEELKKQGLSLESIQSSVRIAAVMSATVTAMSIESLI